MSTTTVSYSATTEEVSLRELRRKEEEARKALRRRLGQAQKAVAAQEARYAELVELLDNRRAQLPDLTFTVPSLPSAPAGQDPSAFENYADTLEGLLNRYERQARQAIADAEIVLERRKQLAAAWTEIHAAEAEIAVRNQACAVLAQRLGNRFEAKAPTALHKAATLEEAQAHLKNVRAALGHLQAQHASFEKLAAIRDEINAAETKIAAYRQDCAALAQRLNERFDTQATHSLHKTATLEEAQAHLKNIRTILAHLQAQHGSLASRVQAREKARALSGSSVTAISSKERQAAWEVEKTRQAREQAKLNIDAALAATKLDMAALPKALQLQAAFALETPQADAGRQVADQINRHWIRLDGIARAEQMLAEPPQYADDSTGAMASRWANLVKRLEAVICGLDEFNASLELEYRQVQEDCIRAMKCAYLKANFFETAADSDFQLSDDDDGLVLMDLEGFPGYYMATKTQQDDDGHCITWMELKADPTVVGDDGRHDSAVTEAFCSKLQEMAHGNDANIVAEVREVERKPKVTRERRPVRRKARVAKS